MYDFVNVLSINFASFYSELNDIGRLVFFITLLLFLILVVLVFIMILQKSIQKTLENKQLKLLRQEEKINISNVNTDSKLQNIVSELQKAQEEKKEITDIYEDDQEKTAIISYKELLKFANGEETKEPIVKKIEPSTPKKQEIFSSVFGPNQEPVYKEEKKDTKEYDGDNFLVSLKEFRNNL